MDWSHPIQAVFDGMQYDLFRYVVGPLIVALTATAIAQRALGAIKRRKEAIIFGAGAFILCVTLFYFVGSRPQRPNLPGAIQHVVSGATDSRTTVAVFSLNILNIGNMPTVILNWSVKATVNGVVYDAAFPIMPQKFTFNEIPNASPNQPESVTYVKEDNLLDKAITPIQVGSVLQGILFVIFQNVDTNVFKGIVDFSITYRDVLGQQYSLSIKSDGRAGQIGQLPGFHTQVSCPVPPGGLPKLGNDLLKKGK